MFGIPSHRLYSALPADESSQNSSQTHLNEKYEFDVDKSKKLKNIRATALIVIATAIVSVLIFLTIFAMLRVLDPVKPRWTSCGKDKATALERNCSFDLISFAWQTPECYDADIVSQFASWDDWTWYADPHNKTIVPKYEVLEGTRTLYVSWDYHVTHCTFMWRQMHRAYERGWIDSHLRAYAHTLHCQDVLLGNTEFPVENRITMARVIYPTCEKVMQSSKELV